MMLIELWNVLITLGENVEQHSLNVLMLMFDGCSHNVGKKMFLEKDS